MATNTKYIFSIKMRLEHGMIIACGFASLRQFIIINVAQVHVTVRKMLFVSHLAAVHFPFFFLLCFHLEFYYCPAS